MTLDELHKAMLSETERLIDARCDSGEVASMSWAVDAMKRRHPGAAPRAIEAVVREHFAARRAAELAGSPADLLAHAEELERYAKEREKAEKKKEQVD